MSTPKEISKDENKNDTVINNNQTQEKEIITSKFNIIEQAKKSLITSNTNSFSKNLIIFGSKHSGKTSIFNSLSSSSPSSSNEYISTFGINYGFMRYQQSSSKKQILNIYEIGGGIENLNLIKTIISSDTILNTLFFLVLDFEKPGLIIDNFLAFIKDLESILKEQIEEIVLKDIISSKEQMFDKKIKNKSNSIFPLNIYLIGNKYDIFEKIEAEKLKWACKALRYFAYTNGFNLLFHSTKDTKLTNILYSTVTHFAFNQSKIENINKYIQKNELRPLYLQYYNDSIEEIGDPKVMQRGGADSNLLWRESYESLFSKKNDAEFEDEEADETFEIEVDKKNWDLYKETRIDNELKIFEKEKQKQNKFN